jgi:hypothetical protein
MLGKFPYWRRLGRLFTWGWVAYCLSGPLIWTWSLLSHWPPDYSGRPDPMLTYLDWHETITGLSAVGLLFWRWRLAIPAAVAYGLVYMLLYTSVGDWVNDVGFAYYIYPKDRFLQTHCHPIEFRQDGKTYRLGLCNLSFTADGQSGFDFVYDTSGDVNRFHDLSQGEKLDFVHAVRAFVHDDPNEIFEISDFHSTSLCCDFYDLYFDDTDSEGFEPVYGPPPNNPQNPYPRESL